MRRLSFILLLVALASASAFATTRTATLPVYAYLIPTVTVSTSPIDFGNFTEYASSLFGYGNITVTAPNGTAYAVTLDSGTHYDGTWRNVENGTSKIQYFIADPTYSFYWGDTGYANTNWGSPLYDTGTGSAKSYTPIGVLYAYEASSSGAAGLYTDYVTVTVNY